MWRINAFPRVPVVTARTRGDAKVTAAQHASRPAEQRTTPRTPALGRGLQSDHSSPTLNLKRFILSFSSCKYVVDLSRHQFGLCHSEISSTPNSKKKVEKYPRAITLHFQGLQTRRRQVLRRLFKTQNLQANRRIVRSRASEQRVIV